MDIKNSQWYRCFKSVCLWSLLSDITVIISFFVSYLFTFIYHDWMAVGWIVPLLTKVFFIWCFAVAVGYLAFIFYSEYVKNNSNLPLFIIEKTEVAFNKIVKNNVIEKIISIISVVSFLLNIFVSVINFYIIIISLITFGILLVIYKNKQ